MFYKSNDLGNFLWLSYIAAISINTIQCNHILCSRNLNAVESGLATNRLRILQVLPASSCSWSASACVAIIASLSKFPVHFIGLKILLPKCAILDLPTWYFLHDCETLVALCCASISFAWRGSDFKCVSHFESIKKTSQFVTLTVDLRGQVKAGVLLHPQYND